MAKFVAMWSTRKKGTNFSARPQPAMDTGTATTNANTIPLRKAFQQSLKRPWPSRLADTVWTAVRIPSIKLSAPQNNMAPIPVAANAAGPKCPTIATSTTLIKTRLRLLKITGRAKTRTSRDTSLSWGKRYLFIILNYIWISTNERMLMPFLFKKRLVLLHTGAGVARLIVAPEIIFLIIFAWFKTWWPSFIMIRLLRSFSIK